MTTKKFKSVKDSILSQNGLLKFTVLLFAISNIILVLKLVSDTNNTKTVFLPPQNTYKEFWVSGNVVSPSYKEMMGNFISQNLLNIAANNANQLVANILPLVDTSTYKKTKAELKKMVNYIVQNDIQRSFHISSIDITQKNQIIVYGAITDFMTSKVLRNKSINLVIDYKIQNGQFFIVNLTLNGLVKQ